MSEKPIVEPCNGPTAMDTNDKELCLRAAVIPPLAKAEGSPDRFFMDSERQTTLILSQLETGMTNLERTVQRFEMAVVQAEQCMNEVEQAVMAQGTPGETSLQPLTQALQTSTALAPLVDAANALLSQTLTQAETIVQIRNSVLEDAGPLPVGTLICTGNYRLIRLLHKRPRVNLYLARRQYELPGATPAEQTLVAVREIVLTGLPQETRQQIVRAAFEEFAAPQIFGSPHLPGVGDHVYVENERHYLIMQPRPTRGNQPASALPLAELLSGAAQHPPCFDLFTSLRLGIRLCQTVARLHRLNIILGEITPEMILMSRAGDVVWAPLLLATWPPAYSFWPESLSQAPQQLHAQIFPPLGEQPAVAGPGAHDARAFAAPELFAGHCDECSDIYALGAILYLLLTGSVPTSAQQRTQAKQARQYTSNERRNRKGARSQPDANSAQPDLMLTPPHILNERISPLLEQILLRALALDPQARFASAMDLADALEGMYFRADASAAPAILPQARVSRLRRLLEWLKK